MSRINSHNEWDALKEAVVGTATGTVGTLTWRKLGPIPERLFDQGIAIAKAASPQWYVDEVAEDLDNLSSILRQFGVVVHRPEPFDFSAVCATPFWSTTSNNLYNVRDLNLVVGNTVVESPSYGRSRLYETAGLYPIWYRYLEEGFRWIAAPKPLLNYEARLPYFKDGADRTITDEDVKHRRLSDGRLETLHRLAEKEILFEAATVLRMGKDLLFLVSSSGNRLALNWLRAVLGDEYTVHETSDIYRAGHIDSTVMCLRPGLVLLNSARVNERNCPGIFKAWDKLYFEEVEPIPQAELEFHKHVREPAAMQLESLGFQSNLRQMSSPWIGMNLLSLDPSTVIVDERQTRLIRELERHKFTVIPTRMRHAHTQCGGIHCATLDTVRESKLESYFD